VKRIIGLASVAAAALLLSACQPDITQARVQDAVGPAFSNLYEIQRSLLGLPPAVNPTSPAACMRTGRGIPNSGAGDDWICQITLSVNGVFQSIFTYELSVRADGCYTAD
jgi:hypothetical protein